MNVSREIPAFCAFFIYSFISQEKDIEKVPENEVKHVIKNLFLLFEVIACAHIGTQGKLACEQVKHVSSRTRKVR